MGFCNLFDWNWNRIYLLYLHDHSSISGIVDEVYIFNNVTLHTVYPFAKSGEINWCWSILKYFKLHREFLFF